ncbi:ArsR/SmtB family transcription factor [Fundicoccus culcitae]|uniref:Metalloregulator ArsR/SmtB family transcription factor n=1 Tax=Fundicoccus culcitae TaxID=2969821 RepID=A0ABY5PA53_9LACT|nr:metalloregulator ArsR/SmtB family transcription factor [Fundicoccus culcitae]UUX35328.1 metalloregulator ArsR/SmtB family transcription factor [Fundicoccus culcitae]
MEIDIGTKELNDKVSVIRILSHPIRYSIALILYKHGVQNVGTIQKSLNLSQSTVSQHISKMREAGIVASRREGTKLYYSLVDPMAIKVIETLG